MKLLSLVLTLIGTALSSQALSAKLEGTYIGTVGTAPVVAMFGIPDVQFEHSYYYRKFGQDIELEQTEQNGKIVLTEYGAFPERFKRATLTGRLESGKFSGTYTLKGGGKALQVTLKPVVSADLKSPLGNPQLEGWKKNNPYTFLKFDRPLESGLFVRNSSGKGKMQAVKGKLGNRAYSWLTEPKSKISLPRLEGSQFNRVNLALETQQLKVARSVLECNVSEPQNSFEYTPQLTFANTRLVSVQAAVYLYCGGAHPSLFSDTLTLEVASGKKLQLEDLYRFAPLPAGVNLQTLEPFEKWETYASARKKVLEKLIYAQRPDLKKNSECYGDETGLEAWKSLSWWLSPQGLVLESNFPHVAAACTEAVTLPYSVLERYKVSKLLP